MVIGQLLITPTVDICIQQVGRVEEMVWIPYDAIRNIHHAMSLCVARVCQRQLRLQLFYFHSPFFCLCYSMHGAPLLPHNRWYNAATYSLMLATSPYPSALFFPSCDLALKTAGVSGECCKLPCIVRPAAIWRCA